MKTRLLEFSSLRKLDTRESRQANEFRLVTSETKQKLPHVTPSHFQISGQTKHLNLYDHNYLGQFVQECTKRLKWSKNKNSFAHSHVAAFKSCLCCHIFKLHDHNKMRLNVWEWHDYMQASQTKSETLLWLKWQLTDRGQMHFLKHFYNKWRPKRNPRSMIKQQCTI